MAMLVHQHQTSLNYTKKDSVKFLWEEHMQHAWEKNFVTPIYLETSVCEM